LFGRDDPLITLLIMQLLSCPERIWTPSSFS